MLTVFKSSLFMFMSCFVRLDRSPHVSDACSYCEQPFRQGFSYKPRVSPILSPLFSSVYLLGCDIEFEARGVEEKASGKAGTKFGIETS
jgi:hypothetical protein